MFETTGKRHKIPGELVWDAELYGTSEAASGPAENTFIWVLQATGGMTVTYHDEVLVIIEGGSAGYVLPQIEMADGIPPTHLKGEGSRLT